MVIDSSLFESWAKLAVIAHWFSNGKPEDESFDGVSKTVTLSYKEEDCTDESLWTETVKPTITDEDIKHFEETFITYEGHYA